MTNQRLTLEGVTEEMSLEYSELDGVSVWFSPDRQAQANRLAATPLPTRDQLCAIDEGDVPAFDPTDFD